MVDTNIFNKLLDGKFDIQIFRGEDLQFFTTHIQRDEIERTPDESRRKKLLNIFHEISSSLPTESGLWDVSKWDEAKWPKDDLVSNILVGLDRSKKKKNNKHDALIADTAIKNQMILLTEDGTLFDVTKQLGGNVERLEDFIKC
ncbi:MAG: hypothetical protein ACE5ER_12190 [Nitrospinaceae bacterium]